MYSTDDKGNRGKSLHTGKKLIPKTIEIENEIVREVALGG